MIDDRARVIQRVCFDIEPSEDDLEALGSRERWLVYRGLVRTRLVGVVEAALPRTKRAVGDAAFAATLDVWMSGGGPATRYFRNVPNDFAELAIVTWQGCERPWVADLARYEIARWWVRHAPPNPTAVDALSFDARPVLATAVRVLRLDYPVHEPESPDQGYPAQPTLLCLYRDHRHRAVPKRLNPIAADLLEAWQGGEETVAESVERVARDHGVEIGAGFVEKLSTLITGLVTEGVILGSASQ